MATKKKGTTPIKATVKKRSLNVGPQRPAKGDPFSNQDAKRRLERLRALESTRASADEAQASSVKRQNDSARTTASRNGESKSAGSTLEPGARGRRWRNRGR